MCADGMSLLSPLVTLLTSTSWLSVVLILVFGLVYLLVVSEVVNRLWCRVSALVTKRMIRVWVRLDSVV